jgi:hypothetical protein
MWRAEDEHLKTICKKKAGILDSGLVDHEMVAGVRFELTTFGLCDLTQLSLRVGLCLHPEERDARHLKMMLPLSKRPCRPSGILAAVKTHSSLETPVCVVTHPRSRSPRSPLPVLLLIP